MLEDDIEQNEGNQSEAGAPIARVQLTRTEPRRKPAKPYCVSTIRGLALVAATAAAALCGFLLYELFLSRLRPGEFERSILITLALSIIILHVVQYAFSLSRQGPRVRTG